MSVEEYFEEWWTPKEPPENGFNKTAMLDFAEMYHKQALHIGDVIPRISHFVSEIGQEYQADDEAVLCEIKDGNLRFYELDYDFERRYLTPVYVA